jgi:hypothetical protein
LFKIFLTSNSYFFFLLNSITVSSINELTSYNIERIISIKGEYEQQIRALETIYSKLCLAYESDNARAWNYSSQYYQQQQQQQQQQQLMQHFAQQAAFMTAAPALLPTHYPQQQSIIHPTQTNNSNGSSSKYIEQQSPNAIYHPSYYVSIIQEEEMELNSVRGRFRIRYGSIFCDPS